MPSSNRQEFEQVALPFLDNLYGMAMRLTRHPAAAEDLVQDTLVKAYRFWHRFEAGTNVKAWLFTIQRNLFISSYNSRKSLKHGVEKKLSPDSFEQKLERSREEQGELLPSPDEAIVQKITRARILEALESLSPDHRMTVTLADLEGLTYREIAEIMDCPIGTVMSRLSRGRKLMHKLLYDHASELGLVEQEEPKAPNTISIQSYRQTKKKKHEDALESGGV